MAGLARADNGDMELNADGHGSVEKGPTPAQFWVFVALLLLITSVLLVAHWCGMPTIGVTALGVFCLSLVAGLCAINEVLKKSPKGSCYGI